jgi:alkylation response protein AidB-like acyl-CoA dehydrogenase
MDLTFTESEQAFRDELRGWLAEHHPGPEPFGDPERSFAFRREWQRTLHEGGWAGVSWPREYGGRGATLIESTIFNEELARARAGTPVNILGLALGGPTLMVHGTDAQRDRYLPGILSADEIWCQGFSEPEAGSDLAALKTRAKRVDGGYVVTGQKVWTSFAHHAKWCMLVARTDPDVPKHKGLTYFLMDMEQDGIQVRPLRQITGEAEFNELFLDEVFIPEDSVVGGEGNGWTVALTTLMNERAGLAFGSTVALRLGLDDLVTQARERGLLGAADVRQRIGALAARIEALRLTGYRGLTTTMRYGQPGPEGSVTKWLWSDSNQELTELAADLLGADALEAGTPWAFAVLRARGNSIEGGTTEILKNIVAERVLGLPRLR